MVLEMPQRWGKYSEFEGGKPAVTCKWEKRNSELFFFFFKTWINDLICGLFYESLCVANYILNKILVWCRPKDGNLYIFIGQGDSVLFYW